MLGVFLVSLFFAVPLVQGLILALDRGRNDLQLWALLGLGLLVALNFFSLILIRRQHRNLDDARSELEALLEAAPER